MVPTIVNQEQFVNNTPVRIKLLFMSLFLNDKFHFVILKIILEENRLALENFLLHRLFIFM